MTLSRQTVRQSVSERERLRVALEEIKWTADAVIAGQRADAYCRGVAIEISNRAYKALNEDPT